MKKIYVKIEGMHCAHCKTTLEKNLLKIKNIKEVEITSSSACLTYTNTLNKKSIIDCVNKLGYYTKEECITENKETLEQNIKLKEFIVILITIVIILTISYKILGFNIFNMIPTIDSKLTYGMLFITGLLTSLHCISMCGAINMVAVINQNTNKRLKSPIFYNLGRIISYTLLGAFTGLIGNIISINKTVMGIIIIISAIIMFFMSLNMLGVLNLKNIKIPRTKLKVKSPFVIGLLNGLMPCGPLQAMQVYALSTSSPIKGALSMLIFGLGTVPLMLTTGIVLNITKGKTKVLLNKIASVLILILSITMLNRGLTSLGINIITPSNNYTNYEKVTIKKNYQVVKINLDYDNYKDILVQKDIPVKLIINVEKDKLTGCNNQILINKFGIKKDLQEGENIIEFTPSKLGNYSYTCWMNMIKNNIKVIDNKKYFKGE